ncbi:MAG: nucleotidyltransferase domain-containing protein [Bacteroidota bacterium]
MTSTLERIIHSFHDTWRERPEYAGLLLTGSFANDTADEGSDIDLRILYDGEVSFREMGECMIDGRCVSFLGMSETAYRATFQANLATTSKFEIRRFTVGIVWDDPYGKVYQLKQHAQDLLTQPMLGYGDVECLHELLILSREYKVFLEMPAGDVFYSMAYFDLLKNIFQFYTQFLQADIPAYMKKWSRFFEQLTYRQVNHLTAFPDQQFVDYFLLAAKAVDPSSLKALYNHVVAEAGGLPSTDFMARFDEVEQTADLYELS